jgi:hypothetical protein
MEAKLAASEAKYNAKYWEGIKDENIRYAARIASLEDKVREYHNGSIEDHVRIIELEDHRNQAVEWGTKALEATPPLRARIVSLEAGLKEMTLAHENACEQADKAKEKLLMAEDALKGANELYVSRVAELEAEVKRLTEPKDTYQGDGVCERCGWPLYTDAKDGCTKGNCSMRPMPPLPPSKIIATIEDVRKAFNLAMQSVNVRAIEKAYPGLLLEKFKEMALNEPDLACNWMCPSCGCEVSCECIPGHEVKCMVKRRTSGTHRPTSISTETEKEERNPEENE